MLQFIKEKTSAWEFLAAASLPIFIYGMGDGALKILAVMKEKRIPIAGFFASDGFVRGHSFEGCRVHSLSEVEGAVKDFIIVLAFAAGYASLIEQIEGIAERHTLLAPDVPVVSIVDSNVTDVFDYSYCRLHENELNAAYSLLADDKSREVFSDIVSFKISGKIPYLSHCTTERAEIYGGILPLSDSETYLDFGAYDGDTVLEFIGRTNGHYKEIYALEPDPKNYRKLVRNVPPNEQVHLLNAAAWNEDTVLNFQNKAGRQSVISACGNSGIPTPAVKADTLTASATLIKLDVEGAERQALLGAGENIKKNAPRLIVAAYHRNEDIFALPLLLHSLQPRYRFYLRHHAYIPAWETLLIASPV